MRTVTRVANPSGSSAEEKATTKTPSYVIEHTSDRALNAIQLAASQATAAARAALPEGEVVIEDVAFVASTNKVISHRLGRAYRDWSVSRLRGNSAGIFEVPQNDTTLDARQITLISNLNCTANIRIR